MALKLKESKIQEMWAAWLQVPSVRHVARACHVSKTTAQKYRTNCGWDARRQRIVKQAEKKADTSAARRLAEDLKIVQAAKQSYASSLLGRIKGKGRCSRCGADVEVTVPVPAMQARFTDINTLVRLEQYLLGIAGEGEIEPKRVKFSIKPPVEDF